MLPVRSGCSGALGRHDLQPVFSGVPHSGGMTLPSGPVGVVCDDRPDVRRTLRAVLERCGIAVAAGAHDLDGLLDAVGSASADVAVVTLPVAGSNGLDVVAAVHRVAPRCRVVVLSPFEALEGPALDAGAVALVDDRDLRGLAAVLVRLVDETAEAAPVSDLLPVQGPAPDVAVAPSA